MTQQQPRTISDADIERMIDVAAARAADQAVARAFGNLGINPTDPDHLRDWHADQLWTRSAREGSKRLSMSMKTTILGTITTALLYAVWRIVTSGTGQP